MQAKLNPTGSAKINFPGFQEILDFTSAGSESSVSVTVDGDTDKEYIICANNTDTGEVILLRLNNDSTANKYGRQYIYNNAGTITSARQTDASFRLTRILGLGVFNLLTPTGFLKTGFWISPAYTSGTTIGNILIEGLSFNSTSNVTSLDFLMESGNFTSGTRITVYCRRSNV
jgi:hypothetical protein